MFFDEKLQKFMIRAEIRCTKIIDIFLILDILCRGTAIWAHGHKLIWKKLYNKGNEES